MRNGMAVLALSLALAGCGSSGSSSSSSSSSASPGPSDHSGGAAVVARCGPRSAPTLAASRLARVSVTASSVYGCATNGSRSYRLGSRGRGPSRQQVVAVRVAGDVAAYGIEVQGVDTVIAWVVARRLSDGKQLHRDPAIARRSPVEFVQQVAAVVVRPNGSLAWTATVGSIVGGARNAEIEVQRHDRSGLSLLDHGPQVRASSLRLRGGTLSWYDGSMLRRAPLR